jgi:hypothetical protein
MIISGGDITSNSYRISGLGLCLGGTVFALISYFFMKLIPLTAVGISAIMIGFACIGIASTRPYISREESEIILRTGMENTAELLEELGLRSKAVYLPSTMRDGHLQALIPVVSDREIQLVKSNILGRLIVRYGANQNDMAIAVTTPGSKIIDMLETKPGPMSGEIAATVTDVLAGLLDIANSVTVNLTGTQVDVRVSGAKLNYEGTWYHRCLGSPIASIVATISSEALQKPVRIREESYDGGKGWIILEVLS